MPIISTDTFFTCLNIITDLKPDECRKVAAAFGFFGNGKLNKKIIDEIKNDPQKAILTAIAIDAINPDRETQKKQESEMPTLVQHAYYIAHFFKTFETSNATKLPPNVVHLIGTIAANFEDADFETTRLICERQCREEHCETATSVAPEHAQPTLKILG